MKTQEKKEKLARRMKEWMLLLKKAKEWAQSKEGSEYLNKKEQSETSIDHTSKGASIE